MNERTVARPALWRHGIRNLPRLTSLMPLLATVGVTLSGLPSAIAQSEREAAKPASSQTAAPATATSSDAAGPTEPGEIPVGTQPADSVGDAAPTGEESQSLGAAQSTAGPRDPKSHYGLWVLLPAGVAILLAIIFRQVVPALLIGLLVGAYMVAPCLAEASALGGDQPLVRGFRIAVEKYLLEAFYDPQPGGAGYDHLKVIIFTLAIGFTVGVMGRNGGTAGMVNLIGGETRSQKRGGFTAWAAGLVVFFDDYSNTMIVGPTMQPVFDRLKISRAKLAYIVDSTSAPVASIALIGTWVGAEIGYIQDGLNALSTTPAFLLTASGHPIDGMGAFLGSWPFRFYPILTLLLVFLVAVTGRDFGPMRKSQRRAAKGHPPESISVPPEEAQRNALRATGGVLSPGASPRAWLGFFPILTLVVVTVAILVLLGFGDDGTKALMVVPPGASSSQWDALPLWRKASTVISNSDSYVAILYGAILSAIAALGLTVVAQVNSIKDATEAGIRGMSNMFPAIIILVLAWAISAVLKDLQLGSVVGANLNDVAFPAHWLPVTVFAAAALISFATGTSWGTMGILCPMTVEVAARLCAQADPATAQPLFFAAVGSVLAGAIFGDHCSPISDTTVLSSVATGCPHEEHVWTQMPYALVTAVIAMGVGDVLCSVYQQPWYVGWGAGAVALIVIVLIFGREVEPHEYRNTPDLAV